MNRKSLAYSGVLLLTLIGVHFLLNSGLVQGVVNNADIQLQSDDTQYVLGQTIVYTGILNFAEDELANINKVRLLVAGSQSLDIQIAVSGRLF